MTQKSFQSSDKVKDGDDVTVTITYLKQTKRSALPMPPRPNCKAAILRAEKPPVHFYRYLYRLIGDPCNWVSRRRMDDETLTAIIHHPSVYIYILYVDGVPGGFAEVDARNPETFHLKFFGLAPDFTGRRLARYFLANVVDLAWLLAPKELHLETCSLDHPAALPLYQKLGFKVFDRREGVVKLMGKPAAAH